MSRPIRRTFKASVLTRSFEPHYKWRCSECMAKEITLSADDERASSGRAPKCERCGSYMAPVNEPRKALN